MENIIVPIPENCSGCMTCMLLCSWKKENKISPSKARIKVVDKPKEGISVPLLCMQCKEPACMNICPAGAISKNSETGAMIVNQTRCVGCKMCMIACPYGAIRLDHENGSILICDLCNGDPACVKVCRTKALQWVPKTKADAVLKATVANKIIELVKGQL